MPLVKSTPVYRRRVDIQQRVVVKDSFGGTKDDTWKTIWPAVPCAIEALSGRELFLAQQVQSDATYKISFRWRPGIDATMRLRHSSGTTPQAYDYYNIEAVIPDDTNRRTLELLCRLRINDGFRKDG